MLKLLFLVFRFFFVNCQVLAPPTFDVLDHMEKSDSAKEILKELRKWKTFPNIDKPIQLRNNNDPPEEWSGRVSSEDVDYDYPKGLHKQIDDEGATQTPVMEENKPALQAFKFNLENFLDKFGFGPDGKTPTGRGLYTLALATLKGLVPLAQTSVKIYLALYNLLYKTLADLSLLKSRTFSELSGYYTKTNDTLSKSISSTFGTLNTSLDVFNKTSEVFFSVWDRNRLEQSNFLLDQLKSLNSTIVGWKNSSIDYFGDYRQLLQKNSDRFRSIVDQLGWRRYQAREDAKGQILKFYSENLFSFGNDSLGKVFSFELNVEKLLIDVLNQMKEIYDQNEAVLKNDESAYGDKVQTVISNSQTLMTGAQNVLDAFKNLFSNWNKSEGVDYSKKQVETLNVLGDVQKEILGDQGRISDLLANQPEISQNFDNLWRKENSAKIISMANLAANSMVMTTLDQIKGLANSGDNAALSAKDVAGKLLKNLGQIVNAASSKVRISSAASNTTNDGTVKDLNELLAGVTDDTVKSLKALGIEDSENLHAYQEQQSQLKRKLEEDLQKRQAIIAASTQEALAKSQSFAKEFSGQIPAVTIPQVQLEKPNTAGLMSAGADLGSSTVKMIERIKTLKENLKDNSEEVDGDLTRLQNFKIESSTFDAATADFDQFLADAQGQVAAGYTPADVMTSLVGELQSTSLSMDQKIESLQKMIDNTKTLVEQLQESFNSFRNLAAQHSNDASSAELDYLMATRQQIGGDLNRSKFDLGQSLEGSGQIVQMIFGNTSAIILKYGNDLLNELLLNLNVMAGQLAAGGDIAQKAREKLLGILYKYQNKTDELTADFQSVVAKAATSEAAEKVNILVDQFEKNVQEGAVLAMKSQNAMTGAALNVSDDIQNRMATLAEDQKRSKGDLDGKNEILMSAVEDVKSRAARLQAQLAGNEAELLKQTEDKLDDFLKILYFNKENDKAKLDERFSFINSTLGETATILGEALANLNVSKSFDLLKKIKKQGQIDLQKVKAAATEDVKRLAEEQNRNFNSALLNAKTLAGQGGDFYDKLANDSNSLATALQTQQTTMQDDQNRISSNSATLSNSSDSIGDLSGDFFMKIVQAALDLSKTQNENLLDQNQNNVKKLANFAKIFEALMEDVLRQMSKKVSIYKLWQKTEEFVMDKKSRADPLLKEKLSNSTLLEKISFLNSELNAAEESQKENFDEDSKKFKDLSKKGDELFEMVNNEKISVLNALDKFEVFLNAELEKNVKMAKAAVSAKLEKFQNFLTDYTKKVLAQN